MNQIKLFPSFCKIFQDISKLFQDNTITVSKELRINLLGGSRISAVSCHWLQSPNVCHCDIMPHQIWVPTVPSVTSTTLENCRLYRITHVHHIMLQIKQIYYRKLCNAKETQGQYVNGKVYHLHGQWRTNIFIPAQIACWWLCLKCMELFTMYLTHGSTLCISISTQKFYNIYRKMPGENNLRGGALEIGFYTTTMLLPICLSVLIFLSNNSMTFVPHPPYSPDMVSCNFFLTKVGSEGQEISTHQHDSRTTARYTFWGPKKWC